MSYQEPERFSRLRPRERQVAELIADGLTNKDIGRTLGISPRTVETHRARAIEKLGLLNTATLIAEIHRNRILREMQHNARSELGRGDGNSAISYLEPAQVQAHFLVHRFLQIRRERPQRFLAKRGRRAANAN